MKVCGIAIAVGSRSGDCAHEISARCAARRARRAASASTNQHPALCRVAAYSRPGLPRPTIRRNGCGHGKRVHGFVTKKARRQTAGRARFRSADRSCRLISCRPSCPRIFPSLCRRSSRHLSPAPFSAALSPGFASSPAAASVVTRFGSNRGVSSTSAMTRGTIAVATTGSSAPRVTADTPRGQLQIRDVDRLPDRESRQVDLDECRKILGQARDVELGQHVADDRVGRLVRRRVLGVA